MGEKSFENKERPNPSEQKPVPTRDPATIKKLGGTAIKGSGK